MIETGRTVSRLYAESKIPPDARLKSCQIGDHICKEYGIVYSIWYIVNTTIEVYLDYMIIDTIKKPYPGQAGLPGFFPPQRMSV